MLKSMLFYCFLLGQALFLCALPLHLGLPVKGPPWWVAQFMPMQQGSSTHHWHPLHNHQCTPSDLLVTSEVSYYLGYHSQVRNFHIESLIDNLHIEESHIETLTDKINIHSILQELSFWNSGRQATQKKAIQILLLIRGWDEARWLTIPGKVFLSTTCDTNAECLYSLKQWMSKS